ncbi:hypothetical protein BJ322DRAFT_1104472 [Thelephora terrestris]|uniref:Uncharacterized protein n=1 Tax=Thelephora terrestris TaxID=56493 RepID=A0A9P6LB58_9AGAM|nr:hypothetical protein BJ322DRAFT_1104472 [Thelephora terrestris]
MVSGQSIANEKDAFFLERLDAFIDKTLFDAMRTFAIREQRPLEQIKRYVAESQQKYLFCSAGSSDKRERIQDALRSVSQTLETLAAMLSVQSFILAIDPLDPFDEGFLGGTTTGREFWRGLRGGGAPGALAFKDHCRRSCGPQTSTALMPSFSAPTIPKSKSKSKRTPASLLKSEVYTAVRAALRKASGVRTAEMRWKNQGSLETYGVRLVGWPANVPMQNPSTLSSTQTSQILNALNKGTMQFLPIGSFGDLSPPAESPYVLDTSSVEENASEMDDYVNYDDFSISGPGGGDATGSSTLLQDMSTGSEGSRGASGPSPFFVSSERSTCGGLSEK